MKFSSTVFIILVIAICMSKNVAWGSDRAAGYHLMGQVVEAVGKTRVRISGKIFAVKPTVPVSIPIVKDGREISRSGSLSDLNVGDRVYIKVNGAEIIDIIVERR